MVRMSKTREFVLICVALLLFCGCSKKEDQQQSQSPTTPASPAQPAAPATPVAKESPATVEQGDTGANYAKMAAENKAKLIEMNKGKDIEPVALDKLKSLLPADLPDMERESTSAERRQMMGINVATADARYQGADSATVDIMIMDAGNLSGPMKMGFTGWTMNQFERETDTGYEKTTKYNGYPAMEEYDRDSKDGAFRVFVADRFVVEVEGYRTTMEKIKQALGKIDMKKLTALASD